MESALIQRGEFTNLRQVGTPLPGRPKKVAFGKMLPGKVYGIIAGSPQQEDMESAPACLFLSARIGQMPLTGNRPASPGKGRSRF